MIRNKLQLTGRQIMDQLVNENFDTNGLMSRCPAPRLLQLSDLSQCTELTYHIT